MSFRCAVVGVADLRGGIAAVEAARGLGAREITLVAVGGAVRASALVEAVRLEAGGALAGEVVDGRAPGRALVGLAREREADLLVLGAPSAGPHPLHRETDRTALYDAPCPILVARGRAMTGTPRAIAAGYDGSRSASAAVEAADKLARELGAPLTVMAVWHTPAMPYAAPVPPEVVAALGEWTRNQLDAVVAGLGAQCRGVVVHGRPQHELRARSGAVDLIVVGTGDTTPGRRVLFGSCADALMRHADCPVLVVPSTPEPAEDAAVVAVAETGASRGAVPA